MRPLDPKLLELFEAEQREHLQAVRELLGRAGPLEAAGVTEALRAVHTLKGAARAVGVASTEQLSHRLESIFAKARDGALVLDQVVVGTVHKALDAIEDVLAAVLANGEEPDVSAALGAIEGVLGGAVETGLRPVAPTPAGLGVGQVHDLPSGGQVVDLPHKRLDMVRVSAASVDDLVRSSSQALAACADQLRAAARTSDLARRRNAWVAHELAARVYQDACRVRMTPAETVFGVFRKMVRDLAYDEGKEVEFRTEGMEVHVDRLVLQRLKDPVMHLLRNAISHGIESPQVRMAAGKARMGTVQLRLEALGDRVKVSVEDDGRGVNFRRVAELAISRGLLSPSDAAPESPRELARFLLEPGFSTSQGLTKLAGRGMGLSVVQEQVAGLSGEVAFPQSGVSGTTVELLVPISISTHHVVLVACGKHIFGIPSRAIGRLCRVKRDQIECLEGGEAIRVDGRPVPLVKLADLVGLAGSSSSSTGFPACVSVVVLRSVRETVGIVVDALLDEREAVIKDLGLPAGMAGMSNGGIAMEDGTVTIVLSPPALVQRFRQIGKGAALRARETEAPKKPPTILVVDDSITTRSLERSILEAHGYHVEVAVDGVEALEKLREKPADLVITDILMPRMDGFQLLAQIKKDKQLARVPVIVVTSLDQRQEHERGIELGADAYIVKQKFDQGELLSVVRQIL